MTNPFFTSVKASCKLLSFVDKFKKQTEFYGYVIKYNKIRYGSLELPERHSVIAVELQIQIVESFALAAVDLVNSLADSGLLVEDGPVQTEEFYVHNLV